MRLTEKRSYRVVLVALFMMLCYGCAANLFVTDEVKPSQINKACGEELEVPYTGIKGDVTVTLIVKNTGACPIEVVDRPATPGAADIKLADVPMNQSISVTVKAPKVNEKKSFFMKCARAEVAGARCTGTVMVVPQRTGKKGAATLTLLDTFEFKGAAGSCDRSGLIFTHTNKSGKKQRLIVTAANTGNCTEFQVESNNKPVFNPPRPGGGKPDSGKSAEVTGDLDDGQTATFVAKCGGELNPAVTGQCKGEVKITLTDK